MKLTGCFYDSQAGYLKYRLQTSDIYGIRRRLLVIFKDTEVDLAILCITLMPQDNNTHIHIYHLLSEAAADIVWLVSLLLQIDLVLLMPQYSCI